MEYSLAGFNGQRPDPVSGFYHLGNGYRACSPALGRFTAPDSWSPFGAGGINPYAYCTGDPVNRADPSGHFSLGQGIGMALGFVAGIALSILTEGAAMPVALTLMATVAGNAAIGAGAELATEAIDGQRINWGQVGIAAGMSTAASLIGFGAGKGLRGVNRRLGSWLSPLIRKTRRINGRLGFPLSGGAEQAGREMAAGMSRQATRGTDITLNNSNLLEEIFNKKLYRVERESRNINEILQQGFSESTAYGQIAQMTPAGTRTVIVAESLEGAMEFQDYAGGHVFEIDASRVRGVSLERNFESNRRNLVQFVSNTKYNGASIDEEDFYPGLPLSFAEAHVYLDDIRTENIRHLPV